MCSPVLPRYRKFTPKPVKKLEKLFIAPKVRQVLYGTSQRALARCACAQRTGFLIKFFNQESVLQGNGRKKAQPQGRAAETVTMFENPPPLDISSHLKIFHCKKKKRTSEDVRFMLALPIFPGRLQPSIVGRSELNFRVRDGNGWTLALISTNCIGGCTLKTEQRNRDCE